MVNSRPLVPELHNVVASPNCTHRQGGVHEAQTVAPSPPTGQVLEDLLPGHLVGNGITSVLVQHVDDHSSLFGRQKLVLVGEVDDEEDREYSEGHSEGSEDDEDPPPGVDGASSGDLNETVGEDLRQSTDEHAHEVEQGDSGLGPPSGVPGTEKVDTSGEET